MAWKTWEDRLLTEVWATGDTKKAAKLLSRHTLRALQERAYTLGLKCGRIWSDEEKSILRKHYRLGGIEQACLHLPRRNLPGIKRMVTILKLADNRSHFKEKLSTEQKELIARQYQRLWPGKTKQEIAKELRISSSLMYKICSKYKHVPPRHHPPH